VSYYSKSLGYFVANHQDLSFRRENTVLTYYYPLSAGDPSSERRAALKRPYNKWLELIIEDLSEVHPVIESNISEVSIWLWGHAMVEPKPGFIWGSARRSAQTPHNNIYFAHSDMSGISIFEEVPYRGIWPPVPL
jgi:hypothetical protein